MKFSVCKFFLDFLHMHYLKHKASHRSDRGLRLWILVYPIFLFPFACFLHWISVAVCPQHGLRSCLKFQNSPGGHNWWEARLCSPPPPPDYTWIHQFAQLVRGSLLCSIKWKDESLADVWSQKSSWELYVIRNENKQGVFFIGFWEYKFYENLYC